jgi:hypothetical protein
MPSPGVEPGETLQSMLVPTSWYVYEPVAPLPVYTGIFTPIRTLVLVRMSFVVSQSRYGALLSFFSPRKRESTS